MYVYKIFLNSGESMEFIINYHISTLPVMQLNGAHMIFFEDAETAINLTHVNLININGELYKIQAYNM